MIKAISYVTTHWLAGGFDQDTAGCTRVIGRKKQMNSHFSRSRCGIILLVGVLAVTAAPVSGLAQVCTFIDDFERPVGNTVGNGWVEASRQPVRRAPLRCWPIRPGPRTVPICLI